ncbi:MAG: hypothetical protein AB2L14_36690 [Candidatus Xenobiia bacterium LiM19]
MDDLRDVVKNGNNEIDLIAEGEGTYMYQIAGKYYMPWKDGADSKPKLSIKVSYDRTSLSADDMVKASASIDYRGEQTSFHGHCRSWNPAGLHCNDRRFR